MLATRIVLVGCVGCLSLLLMSCGNATTPSAKPATSPGPITSSVGTGPAESKSISPEALQAAAKTASEFLTALNAGKATAAQLTPGFKKIIAEPVTASDRAVGYSDWAADQWLAKFTGLVDISSIGTEEVSAECVLVKTRPLSRPMAAPVGRVVAKLTNTGGSWQVAWLYLAPVEISTEGMSDLLRPGNGKPVRIAAAAFLDAALTGEVAIAEGLLTTVAKGKLAPPVDTADTTRGYNRGILRVKLSGFRESAVGYTWTPDDTSGANGTVAGSLVDPDKKSRPFKLTLAAGAGGDWQVTNFEPN